MPYISGKQAFLELLKQEGVSVMFGNPGTTALTHPTGPVFLSLPVDVLNSERDLDLTAPTRVARRIVGDRGAIAEAARLLANAERPLLVAGDAVAHGDALAELVELAELLGAPVMTEGVASTCSFPFPHPLYSGSMPRLGPPIRALLMRHDLLFSVGGDLFTLSLPDDVDPMPPGITIVHLDVNPWELGKNYPAAVAIQGDPKATLPELGEAVRRLTSKEGHPDAPRRRGAVRAAWESERAAHACAQGLLRRGRPVRRDGPRAAHRLRRHGAGARRPGGACGEDAGDRPRDRSGVCQRRPVPGRRPHRPRVQVRSLVVAARPAP